MRSLMTDGNQTEKPRCFGLTHSVGGLQSPPWHTINYHRLSHLTCDKSKTREEWVILRIDCEVIIHRRCLICINKFLWFINPARLIYEIIQCAYCCLLCDLCEHLDVLMFVKLLQLVYSAYLLATLCVNFALLIQSTCSVLRIFQPSFFTEFYFVQSNSAK